MNDAPPAREDQPGSQPHPTARPAPGGRDHGLGPLRLISVVSAALIVVLLINALQGYAALRRLADEDLELVRLTGRIVHLDEVLTMSARMAASTGSEVWSERYRRAEPELDRVIKGAIELAPEADSANARLTDEANRELVALEQACLAAVDEGRLDEARELVFSDRYEQLKSTYHAGVQAMVRHLDERTDGRLASARWWAVASGVVAVLAVAACFSVLSISAARAQREQRLRDELALAERRSTLGGLAAGLAHELNQPLAAVVHFTGAASALCERQAGDPELLSALRGAAEQAERAGAIVHRVREFSRSVAPSRGPVDVGEAIRVAVSLVGANARAAGVKIRTELRRPLPPALADAVQVEQVLVNLLLNAVESSALALASSGPQGPHAGARGVVVRAGAERGFVVIEVEDRGAGVRPEHRARLFEAFFTTKASGMGLGLAIARDIVEGFGGTIEAEPLGVGLVCRVRLPEASR